MFKKFPTLSRQYNNNNNKLKMLCKINLKSLKTNTQLVMDSTALVCLHVKSLLYKTFYTLTSLNGKILLNLRTGDKRVGQFFNKRKRFSKIALMTILYIFIKIIKRLRVKKIILIFNGLIRYRTSIVKRLLKANIKVYLFKYNPKLPHNGCRLPKPRSGFKI